LRAQNARGLISGNEEGEYESFGWGKRSGNVWVRFSYILRICIEDRKKRSVLSFRKNGRWSCAYGQGRSVAELGGVGGRWMSMVRVLER
jgi:hypothetical protein